MQKNSLSIKEAMSDSIVCIESSCLSFVDQYYFKETLKEDVEDLSYVNLPVTLQALRVDWIIHDELGKDLLEAISLSDNDELFNSKTI